MSSHSPKPNVDWLDSAGKPEIQTVGVKYFSKTLYAHIWQEFRARTRKTDGIGEPVDGIQRSELRELQRLFTRLGESNSTEDFRVRAFARTSLQTSSTLEWRGQKDGRIQHDGEKKD